MATSVEIYNLGTQGIVGDKRGFLLDPEAWTDGKNVRFTENGVILMSGHQEVLGSWETEPEFLMAYPGFGKTYWFYFDLEAGYVIDETSHVEVTRVNEDLAIVPYNANAGRDWNGTILGGIPIFNNGTDVPQWWSAVDINTPLEDLANWPSTLRAKVIRAFGSYLIALNLVDNGVALPQAIQWSHKADPGSLPSSWDNSDPTVDAGRTFLTDISGGEILDGVLMGERLIIYKENSTHALRFVGGNDIFAPNLLLAATGAMAARCACAFRDGTRHLVLTQDDIIVHQGTSDAESVVDLRNRRKIFNAIDVSNYRNCHVFHNSNTNEIWVCYPETGSVYPTKAAIWNYKFDTWTFRDFDGVGADFGSTTAGELGVWDELTGSWDSLAGTWGVETRKQMLYINRVRGFALDTGFRFDGAAINASLERVGISIDGKSRDGKPKGSIHTRKLWTRLWPKLSGGSVNISVGVKQTAEESEPIAWDPAQLFNPSIDKFIDFELNGRLLALRFESATQQPWTLSGYDLEVQQIQEL
jgi:hypothetical protein